MPDTRRSFLGGLGGVIGLYLPSAAASTHGLKSLLEAAAPASESYWRLVAEQFPIRPGKIMMNAANLCPAPRAVADRVTELARDIDSDVSFQNRAKFADLLEQSRLKVASQLGVSPDEVALVRNTSEANNIINNGSPLHRGDEVVIFDQNHPCNNVAWDVRAARFGFTVKRVSVPEDVRSPQQILRLFEAALTNQTKLLSVTHVSNTSGIRLPVKELCAMARAKGIYSHVDGAQTWGFLKLDLKDMGCDSFSASAHKWLMGPKQVGLLYIRAARVSEIWANVVTVGWGSKVETAVKGARKFEVFGQRDDAALAAVATAVDFHGVLGAEAIESRTMGLAGAVHAGLVKLNRLKMTTPGDPGLRGGVVVAELPPGVNRGAFTDALYAKYGVAGAPVGGLRLAPHVYNTKDDVNRV
jgi:isopenicillin-N epimerase